MLNQKGDIEDHKILWQSNISKFSECLIKSARWKSGLADAAACSTRDSDFSRRLGRDEVRRRLPGLAYEDLVGKTGPGHPRRDGQPRRLRHILSRPGVLVRGCARMMSMRPGFMRRECKGRHSEAGESTRGILRHWRRWLTLLGLIRTRDITAC